MFTSASQSRYQLFYGGISNMSRKCRNGVCDPVLDWFGAGNGGYRRLKLELEQEDLCELFGLLKLRSRV